MLGIPATALCLPSDIYIKTFVFACSVNISFQQSSITVFTTFQHSHLVNGNVIEFD